MQENHFDPVAVIQKVILFNHQGKVLVVKKAATEPCNSIHWDLPGGRVHKGEDFEKSIRRKVEEETGIRPSCLALFRTEPTTFPDGEPLVAMLYTAFARIDPKLSGEHSNFEWIDPKKIGQKNWVFSQLPQWICSAHRPQSRGAICIVENNGDILLLKRSKKVAGWAGWYYGVAGTVEDGEEPIDTAYRELNEEIGLSKEDIEFVKAGEPFKITDFHTVYPFRLKSKKRNVKIDWEHDEAVWVNPEDVVNYNCVPFFKLAAKNLDLEIKLKANLVTCAVFNNGRILLLKQSPDVGTQRGIWGIVTGYIEPGEHPEETAYKGVREKLNLDPSLFRMVRSAEPRVRSSDGITYTIYPFIFEASTDQISIDWEHDEYIWIDPKEVTKYNLSSGLMEVLDSLGIVQMAKEM